MVRVYLADAKIDERIALRFLLHDLNMELIGEAENWPTTLAEAPVSNVDLLLVDWDLLPESPVIALTELRAACPAALVIVLISHMNARHQAARSAGADVFISKEETPERMASRLKSAVKNIRASEFQTESSRGEL